MMEEKETYTKEEVEKALGEARRQQIFQDFGKQWFLEALSHTASLVNQAAFPPESHRVGQICYDQFAQNTGMVKAAPEKPKEEPADE